MQDKRRVSQSRKRKLAKVDPRTRLSASRQLYLVLSFVILFVCVFQILYLVLPKASESKVERRKLQSFPDFTVERFASGQWHREIEAYLSDHLPFRNFFIKLDNRLKSAIALPAVADGDEEVEIIRGERELEDRGNQMVNPNKPKPEEPGAEQTATAKETKQSEVKGPNLANTDGEVAFQSYALIIKGTQGMEIFNYSPESWSGYAARINYLRSVLPADIRVFSLAVPTAVAFYGPETYRQGNYSSYDALQQLRSELDPQVIFCDAYSHLSPHSSEYIYFRTDHHWTGRGAYYGYESFCAAAGFDPTPLEKMIVSKSEPFLGTIYANSEQNQILANNPDVCEYFRPLHVGISEMSQSFDFSNSWQGPLLDPAQFPDYPYLGYSGGDVAVIRIKTEHQPPTNRRIGVLKDSYGNALVPFLMDHYDEVYVIDARAFDGNLIDFISEHQINDFLFINYTFATSNPYWLEGFDTMTGYQP
ncbi:MAG: DHHW family protein [Eubacteriales bacterium]|nr:DHHW family protein [Eubacteriales bacterium]